MTNIPVGDMSASSRLADLSSGRLADAQLDSSTPRLLDSDSRAFHILTLGCSKNRVDSDGMDHLLRQRGMTASERPEDARVVIVNTCGFLGAARDESVAAISELLGRR